MYYVVIHNKLMRFNGKSEKNNNSFNKLLAQGINFRIGIVIFVIIAILILNLSPFSKSVKGFFYSLSEPIQLWLWEKGIKTSAFFQGLLNADNLSKENIFLKSENRELLNQNIELEKLKKENETLRIALGLGIEKEFTLEIAQIIAKEISNDYLIINKGFSDGIRAGFPVITETKVLVGKISELYENISKVELLSSKNSSFDIEIFKKEIYSLAKGSGNFKITLDLIPKEENIEIGDKVISSVVGGNFPEGLLIGEIEDIKKSDTAAFQQAEVKPGFDIRDLRNLFIISNSSFSEQ
ncbi:MAG: rod shape-determining protein MreC [Candidatus Nealsonbacteria bacterium]